MNANEFTPAAALPVVLRVQIAAICYLPLRDEMVAALRAGTAMLTAPRRALVERIAALGDEDMTNALASFDARPVEGDFLNVLLDGVE